MREANTLPSHCISFMRSLSRRTASSSKWNVRQNLSSEEESFWAPYIAVLPSTEESMPRICFENFWLRFVESSCKG